MPQNIADNERINQLFDTHLSIIQSKSTFAFSIDSVLLAHFATFTQKQKKGLTFDLGSGTGAVGLAISQKVDGPIILVEIQEKIAELSRRSVVLNGLQEKISVLNQDMTELKEEFGPNVAQTIVSNPPYFSVTDDVLLRKTKEMQIARHEVTINLEKLIQISKYLLSNKGHFFFVYQASRVQDVLFLLTNNNFGVNKIQFVRGKRNKMAELVLVDAIKDGGIQGTKVLPDIVTHDDNGQYTSEMSAMYGFN